MTLKDYLNENDRFAASCGMKLTEIKEGYAKAEMTVENRHLNGGGVCQGGALFTLGDLAVAAAVNSHKSLTFGIQNNIAFLQSAKLGDKLTAEAKEVFNHPKIPFVNVEIRNQNGDLIAVLTGQGYRKKEIMNFDTLI
ncbi:MAG: hotdog fold thioesterase [Bacteroidales bacterium]|nr:hotdog fold thioesterase [Bacteroidales bacterium]